MDEYPKISIITPSLNQGRFIERCIRSVIDQNYPNLEYIIIDGGSTDNTIEVIKRHTKKIFYWVSESDAGQSDAINKGLLFATGDIVAWINSDDYYVEGIFEKVVKIFQSCKNVMWVCGNVIFVNENDVPLFKKKPIYTPFVLRYGTSSLYQPGVFFRQDVFKQVGYLATEYHAIMDQEFYCRVSKLFKPIIVNENISYFRLHQNSKTCSSKTSLHRKRYIKERQALIQKFPPTLIPKSFMMTNVTMHCLALIARTVKLIVRICNLLKQIIPHEKNRDSY